MADENTSGPVKRRVVSKEERERRIKAARRKKITLRVVFMLIAIAIIIVVISLFISLGKAVKKLTDGSSGASKYSCATFQLRNAGSGEIISNGNNIFIYNDGTLSCVRSTGALVWSERIGGTDVRVEAYQSGIVVYEVLGNVIRCFDDTGLLWERTEEAPVRLVELNPSSSNAIICTEPEDCLSKVIYISTKTKQSVAEPLLEKKYTFNYVISAAISPGGKDIAIAELADSADAASTRVSVIDVSSGRSFFSRLLENEVCPYCAFAGESNLAIAGRKNAYIVEKIDTTNARAARFSSLVTLGDSDREVISMITAKNNVALAIGDGDGKSDITVFEVGSGSGRTVSVPRTIKGFMSCLDGTFAVYTQNDFMVFDFEGNKLAICDDKLDIQYISNGGGGHYVTNGENGTIVVNVRKAG